MNLNELMERLGVLTRECIDGMITPVVQRLSTLEARALIPGPQGERGEKGQSGDRGEAGAPGTNGRDGLDGKDGAPGERGHGGATGERGDQGPPGIDGKDGAPGPQGAIGPAGPEGAAGLAGEMGPVGPQGEPGPKGEPGKDGEPGPRGEPGMAGKSGEPGAPGKKGDPGKDAKDGRDGRDGKDGEKGRDALELTVLTGIDETKSYPGGTYAEFRGGLIRAVRVTDPVDSKTLHEAGWSVVMNGIDREVEELLADGRTTRRTTTYTNGRAMVTDTKSAQMIYRGVYKRGDDYAAGDVTTWGGSMWVCHTAPAGEPGLADSGWQLSVKKGRDGRDR